MSRSTIAQRKSSPCCIGCVVLLIIAIGLSLAGGIFMYKFAKNNLSFTSVAAKADPPLDIPPSELLPARAGDFTRESLLDTLENVPEWHDAGTTSAHVAVYEDPQGHQMTVIAVSTQETRQQRAVGSGLLTMGRSTAGAPETAVTIKDTFSGPGTRVITTWSKPNWTFMVQTSSTLMKQFIEDFHPGGEAGTTATESVESAEDVDDVPPASAPVVPQGRASLASESLTAEDAQTTGL